MKRALIAALCAALPVLALLAARPAAAQSSTTDPPQAIIPRFIEPQLFRGFEPSPPDQFGLSPRGGYLVFRSGRQLSVVRTGDNRIAYSQQFLNHVDPGFDPFDNFLYLLERRGGGFRFMLVDLEREQIVFDRQFREQPEIRTNLEGSLTVLIQRDRARSTVLVLNGAGRQTLRRSYDPQVNVGLNLLVPAVAVLSTDRAGVTRIEVFDGERGRTTLRATATRLYQAGFEPSGPAFVVGSATSVNTFRVRMVQSISGRNLLNRNFAGTLNVGFTPDSSLLGVQSRLGTRFGLFLFRTASGDPLNVRQFE